MGQLVRQKDTVSLVRNGNFTAGLSGWHGSATHQQASGDASSGTNVVLAPHYVAEIEEGGSISQIISRSDVYLYPSRRYVSRVDMIPIGLNTYKLQAAANTRLDGVPTFGEGFFFEDEEGEVTFLPGQQIELEDVYRIDNGGPYRVGQIFDDGGIEVSPIEHEITKLVTSDDYSATTYSSNGTIGTVTLTGTNLFSRQEDVDSLQRGIQANDIFVFSDPTFAVAKVLSVSVSGSTITCQVGPVTDAAFLSATGNDPNSPPEVTSEEWFLSTLTQGNFQRDLNAYQYSYTLALSHDPDQYDGLPKLEVVDDNGDPLYDIPLRTLENGQLFESLSLSSTGDTPFQRRLYWFFQEYREPHNNDLRLTIPGGTDGVQVGDVVLYKGNFTRRHDYDDRDDSTLDQPADSRSALDRMVHGTDEYDCAIPKGTVILYTGGPVCPPGFKRVDGLRGATDPGIEYLPYPDTVTYDGLRNRTILEWVGVDFPVMGADGKPIPLEEDSTQVQVILPSSPPFHSAIETITIGPTLQRVQPGMSIRIRATDEPGNYDYDFSSPVRQAFSNRVEVQGRPQSPASPENDISYPVFMAESDFSAGERFFEPIGPPAAQQPTSLSVNTLPTAVGVGNNGAPFSGLSTGAATMTLTGVTATGLTVGQHVYVRWTSGTLSSTTTGGFIGTVTSVNTGNITVKRTDGNSMVVDGVTGAVSGTATLSDALIFGSDVLINQTRVANVYVWSARRFDLSTTVALYGDVTEELALNSGDDLLLEPSGFVRYGDGDFDIGSAGHSHEITRGDAEFDSNAAPRVNDTYNYIPPTRVAKEHGHGYFPKFHHVIPRFFAAIPCIKM